MHYREELLAYYRPVQALACGVPVVASKADASREIVLDEGLGVVVNPDQPEEIREGILLALRQTTRLVPDGLNRFSRENFDRRCGAILQECVGKSPASEATPEQPVHCG